MQKTTTLKDFKVLVLKTVLSILVLGISFQVSFAQQTQRVKGQPVPPFVKKHLQNAVKQNAVTAPVYATDVPAVNQRTAANSSGMLNLMTSNGTVKTIVAPAINIPGNPPTTNLVQDVCVFNGSLTASDPQIANRIVRNGVPSSCAAPKACPGQNGTGPVYYDTYTMQNLTCSNQCVTVNFENVGGDGDVFVVAYNGSFNNTNVCTNYLADGGSSVPVGFPSITYTFNVPANATIVFVAAGVANLTTMSAYRFTVTGLNCTPPPPCTGAPTSSVLSQVQVPAVPVQLFNLNFDGAAPWGQPVQNLSAPLGLTGWAQTNSAVFPPHTGVGQASTNFNNTSGVGTISNWMFLPVVNMKDGDVFTFWTRTTSGTFPDRLQVRRSVNGASVNAGATATSVGDFSTLLVDINPTYTSTGYPTAYTQYTLTMSGLGTAGVSGRIAFRYFVENGGPAGANSDFIGIDDAIYTQLATANPTTCTGSTANLQVITNGTAPLYNLVINANPPGGPGGNFNVNNYASGTPIPITPAVTTTYTLVSVIDANNPCCIGTGNSGTPTVVVSATPMPAVGITALPDPPLCAGNPTLLTAVLGSPLANWFLTQSNSQTVLTNSSVACTVGPNSWWRVYDLATYPLVGNFTITNTQFMVEQANAAQNVTVQLYTQTGGAFPGGTRTPIPGGNVVVAVPAGNNQNIVANFAVPPVVPNNSVIVVSVTVPAANWWIGANASGETSPGYLSAPACGFPNPTTFTAIGFPSNHIILNLNGTTGGGIAPLPAGWTTLWSPAAGLSNPNSNPVGASPMVTTTYQVLVTATSGPSAGCQTTANKLITVNQLPAVLTNPTSTTACAGANASFGITASGAGISYQWQVSTTGCAGAFANVVNGGVYSGATTNTLNITGATVAMNGYAYRCVVTGTCPPAATSTCATLTVNALPVVTISPASPVCGGVAGINGTALTASGATSYIWSPVTGLYTNATATTAYTGTNLATVYAAPAITTIYTVNGTAAGTGCSNTASIKVLYTPPAPVVTPSSVTMCLGDPAVRLVSASASPGTCTTTSAVLSIPIPDNTPNGISNNLIVSCLPAGATVTGVSVTVNVPNHTYVGDMIINLKAPNGVVLNLDKYMTATATQAGTYPNSGFNATISSTGVNALGSATSTPITGTWKADLINGAIPFAIQEIAGFTSTAVNWNALYTTGNGTWTLAIADGGPADLGTLTGWSIKIDYLIGVPTTAATWAPLAGLFNDAAASIAYTGDARDTVWTRPTPAGVYPYTATVRGLPEPGPSNPGNIVIPSSGTGTPYPSLINVNGYPTTGVSVQNVILTGVTHTWGDDIDILLQSPTGQNVVLMSDVGGTVAVPNATYTFSDAGPNMAAGAANPTGTYHVTNNGATDTWIAPGPGSITQATPALSMFGSVANVNGDWKLFVVDDTGGDQGNITGGWAINFTPPIQGCLSPARTVVVTVNTTATVTLQPVNQTICTDKVATFTVAATIPLGTIAYQWQVSTDNGNTFSNITNGGVYSGATTPTLTITNPPVSMNGYAYRVRLQGPAPCGPVYSFFRILTVNPLPTIVISASPYTRLFPGLITTLSSSVSPVAGAVFTWYRDGIVVAGATGPTLQRDVDGLGDYQLKVTDLNGCTNLSNIVSLRDSVSSNCFLYPNPNKGLFQVRYHSITGNVLARSVTVYNSNGTRVLTQYFTVVAPYARMDLDLRPYGKGVYWVEVGDHNGNRLTMCRALVQ